MHSSRRFAKETRRTIQAMSRPLTTWHSSLVLRIAALTPNQRGMSGRGVAQHKSGNSL
jgi:hypothetical protein